MKRKIDSQTASKVKPISQSSPVQSQPCILLLHPQRFNDFLNFTLSTILSASQSIVNHGPRTNPNRDWDRRESIYQCSVLTGRSCPSPPIINRTRERGHVGSMYNTHERIFFILFSLFLSVFLPFDSCVAFQRGSNLDISPDRGGLSQALNGEEK